MPSADLATREIHERRRSFHTLDGLRGIAALIVVFRHAGALSAGIKFPLSFLAVDLFFLISGFIVAHAYGEKLRDRRFLGEFFKIRMIRLYPLYFLGLVFGALYWIELLETRHEAGIFDILVRAFLAGLLMIPQTPLSPIVGSTLNSPTWTLLPEITANLLYARFVKFLTTPVLAGIVACGAIGLIGCEYEYGTIDAGWDASQAPVIISRLAYSFFGGVLLFKLAAKRGQTRRWASWACVAGTAAALTFDPPLAYAQLSGMLLVMGVFPLILWVACHSEPGPVAGKLFRFLGLISYAIYTLHRPLSQFAVAPLRRFVPDDTRHLATMILFMSALILMAWLADRYYDGPVRHWLARNLARPRRLAPESPP